VDDEPTTLGTPGYKQMRTMKRDNTKDTKQDLFADMKVVYAYTRVQAITDGVLVDVSALAKEARFKIPVALTAAAWESCVRIPDGVTCQDETGRLWDVLNVLMFAIRAARNNPNPSVIHYTVSVRNSNEANEDILLKAVCSPGDDAEPVITIMLPEED
jgi:hypothetical protein